MRCARAARRPPGSQRSSLLECRDQDQSRSPGTGRSTAPPTSRARRSRAAGFRFPSFRSKTRPGGVATGMGHAASGQLWPGSGDWKDPTGGGALVQSLVLGPLQSPASSLPSGAPTTGDRSSVCPERERGGGGRRGQHRVPGGRPPCPGVLAGCTRARAAGRGTAAGGKLGRGPPNLRPEPRNPSHPCGIN